MLAEALQAEVDTYVAQFADERDEHGHRLVVRNGSHQPRDVLTSAGRYVFARRGSTTRARRRHRPAAAVFLGDPAPWARKTPRMLPGRARLPDGGHGWTQTCRVGR